MKRFSEKALLNEIINGNEEILVDLSKNYFRAARRFLRMRGFRDVETPEIFSEVLARVFTTVQRQKPAHLEFGRFFMDSLRDEITRIKTTKNSRETDQKANPQSTEIASQCFSILDIDVQKILSARITEKLNYEKIAYRFQFSNAVIAQYEINKALSQLESIVRLRMNISQN